MDVIEISFKHLLSEIAQKLSIPAPKYGLIVDTSGQLSAYVDVEIERSDSVTETIRSWGLPAYVAGPSEEDATRKCIITLRSDLGFTIRDANFEDVKFYKNLYTHLSDQYNTLLSKYNTLKWDYKLLKDCYNKASEERDRYFSERSEIHQSLKKVFDIINGPTMVVDTLEEDDTQDPSNASE